MSHRSRFFRRSGLKDDTAETFFETVVNAATILSFRGRSVDELKTSFHDIVDTCLDDCDTLGINPEKPYNGKIALRVAPELHRLRVQHASTSFTIVFLR